MNSNFTDSTVNNWESNAVYKTCITCTEGEIIEVM